MCQQGRKVSLSLCEKRPSLQSWPMKVSLLWQCWQEKIDEEIDAMPVRRLPEKKNDNVEQTVSCVDVTGRNGTKCPCFTAGLACKDCKCYNCENSFGMNARDTPKKGNCQEKRRKSTLSTPPSLKRRWGTEYLRENNIAAGWSQLENCVLEMTENFVSSSNLQHSLKNICTLYNFVIDSNWLFKMQFLPL